MYRPSTSNALGPVPPRWRQRKPATLHQGKQRLAAFFVGIPIAVMLVILVGPIAFNAVVSFFDWDLLGTPPEFSGVEQYQAVLSDPRYLASLGRTVLFVVITVGLEMVIGFAVAYLLYRHFSNLTVLQILFLLPMMISDVVAALAWRLLLSSETSLMNWLIGLLGVAPQQWLGPDWAFTVIVIVDVWMWTPFVVLVMFAAMQGMPRDVLEAGAVDGAAGWRQLRFILLPLLQPAILVILLFRTIISVRVFSTIWILTGGGPADRTAVLGIDIYRVAFQSFDVGLSAAIGMLLLGVSIVIGVLYVRLMRRDPIY